MKGFSMKYLHKIFRANGISPEIVLKNQTGLTPYEIGLVFSLDKEPLAFIVQHDFEKVTYYGYDGIVEEKTLSILAWPDSVVISRQLDPIMETIRIEIDAVIKEIKTNSTAHDGVRGSIMDRFIRKSLIGSNSPYFVSPFIDKRNGWISAEFIASVLDSIPEYRNRGFLNKQDNPATPVDILFDEELFRSGPAIINGPPVAIVGEGIQENYRRK